LKIAVNTRLLRKDQLDGIGWFSFNVLKRITTNNPDIEFHFFFDSRIDKQFLFGENITSHKLFPPAKHALLNIAWFEWSVKKALNRLKPDLFFSPDGILSLGWKGKQYGVIHDINFIHQPGDLKFSNRKYYNHFFPKFARRAERLATVSNYSKNDLVTTLGIDPEKIDVVYCGINSFYKPIDIETKKTTRNKYAADNEYFVFIGTLSPRKNVLRLMEAFDLFKRKTAARLKLLIVGASMYKTNQLEEKRKELSAAHDIIFTGRLADDELNLVLASAFALVFVPTFEGFGIPLVEAMQCEIPIIASNVTSVPEITGDAALVADPYSIEEITAAMIEIFSDDNLRKDLIAKGNSRKQFFSWDKTSDLLWQSIKKCL